MFSYLDTAKSLVDSSVFGRGVRLYLEGKVSDPRELDLEFWREYEVYDRKTYTVRIPVLHLAMKRDKLNNAAANLADFATCECEFYQELGVCKHIVAVCDSLEQEFGQKPVIPVTSDSVLESESEKAKPEVAILDRIFEVDVEKKSRRWESEFEHYLSQSGTKIPRSIQNMVGVVTKDPHLYTDLLKFIKSYSTEATDEYGKEKNLIRFMIFTLGYNTEVWIEMWLTLLAKLLEEHRRKFVLELWVIIKSTAAKKITKIFELYLKNLTEDAKSYYILELQKIYVKNKNLWLDFVEVSQATGWIHDHYMELDPLTLLRFAELVPDLQEEIEISILNQIKQWGDFLQAGEYDEIIEVFARWKKTLGRSSYLEEAVAYFKSAHSKKRKLITNIDN